MQREQIKKKALLPVSPWKGLNYILSQLLPEDPLLISLHLGADSNSTLWDIDGSWHTLNYWEPLRTKSGVLNSLSVTLQVAWRSESLERQPRAQTGLIDEVYLLYEIILSRL